MVYKTNVDVHVLIDMWAFALFALFAHIGPCPQACGFKHAHPCTRLPRALMPHRRQSTSGLLHLAVSPTSANRLTAYGPT